jgi:hypothetical protein
MRIVALKSSLARETLVTNLGYIFMMYAAELFCERLDSWIDMIDMTESGIDICSVKTMGVQDWCDETYS